MREHWRNIIFNPRVTADLERLYPGNEREKLRKDYYVSKTKKSAAIALAGTLLAILLGVRAASERKIDPGNLILRDPSEAQSLKVETVIGDTREEFQIQVAPIELSEGEAEALCGQFTGELPDLIRGENASLREVREDLYLEERYEGYPFSVEWRSSDVEAVTSSGVVKTGDGSREVILEAEIFYGEMSWEKALEVTVLPALLGEKERRHRALEAMLVEAEADSRREEKWNLPAAWEGEEIVWRRAVNDYSRLLWAGALIVAILVYFMADKDLHDRVEKRKDRMKLEYPDIVHKLVLYLGAGLTLRGAFQKIAAEYERGRMGGRPEGAAYEEMLYTCRELQAGVSEVTAYERFGKRTGLQEYIRLTTLLAQNLKKGSSTLLQRLREEADRSTLERIQSSRRLGEEASTKLLVPMVMMLAVVMVMVMLPALSSMGS